MEFIGVRISWLILAKNSVFASAKATASSLAFKRACCNSISAVLMGVIFVEMIPTPKI
jgi:hypothetical protein